MVYFFKNIKLLTVTYCLEWYTKAISISPLKKKNDLELTFNGSDLDFLVG